MHRQNENIEGLPQGYHSREDDWLSKKFNSLPFLLYKFWLLVNFGFAFGLECYLVYEFQVAYSVSKPRMDQMLYISLNASLLLLSYGCGEMLFAINRRKSSAAQRSFLKFQYYLIGALIYVAVVQETIDMRTEPVHFVLSIYVVISVIVLFIGGHAVLKAFQNNHPLRRQDKSESSEVSNPFLTDFLEQNEAIASEVLKYEQKLNSWPYLVYNWWLKLAVVFEICVIFGCIFSLTMIELFHLRFSFSLFLFIGALILSLFNAYSRFEMEAAVRTRTLARSKRAVLLLKISIVSTMFSYLFVAIKVDSSLFHQLEFLIPTFKWFGIFAVIPVLCLAGAVKVHKLIEERDCFARISSFPEDTFIYL